MTPVLVYLMEASLCLAFFWLIYRIFLGSLTFFAWNRTILLMLLVLSLAIPLLSFDPLVVGGQEVVGDLTLPVYQVGEQLTSGHDESRFYLEILFGLYLLGVAITAFRLIGGLIKALQMIARARKITFYQHQLVIDSRFVPSSFFGYILLPEINPESSEQRQVILHESMHVRLKHSWDLIFINLVKIGLWFNPLVYFFEKSLREVHEFQADQGVIHTFSPKEYATLLLGMIRSNSGWQFMNNFNHFQTKKRIIMMAKGNSSAIQRLRFLALLPVAGILLFMFSCEKEDMNPQLATIADFQEIIEVPLTVEDIQVVPYEVPKENKTAPAEPILDADEIFDVVEQQPNPAGGMSGWNSYLSQNLQYPQKARELGIEGTVIVVFEIHKDGSIHQVEILRGIGGGADEEAVRVVQNAPNWEPGRQRGKAVKTRMRLPIRFKMASSTGINSETAGPNTGKIKAPEGSLGEVLVVAYSSPKNF